MFFKSALIASRVFSSVLKREFLRKRQFHRACRLFCAADKYVIQSEDSDVSIPNNSITEHFFNLYEKYADRIYLVNGETGQCLTYAETREQSICVASALSRLGVNKGDVVSIVSPNCPEYIVTVLGIISLGAIASTCSPSFTEDEIQQQLQNSDTTIVFCHADNLNAVRKAKKSLGLCRHIIGFQTDRNDDVIPFPKLLQDDGKGIPNQIVINPADDVALLPYSSGTTGLPKGVMITHRNLVANHQQTMHKNICELYSELDEPQEVVIGTLPVYHIYGLFLGLSYSAGIGMKFVTQKKYSNENFVDLIEKYRATVIGTVPPILSAVCTDSYVTPEKLSTLRFTLVAAAPVGKALVEKYYKKFPSAPNLLEGYGLTESSPVTHIMRSYNIVPGSCGKHVPNTFIKLVDIHSGEPIDSREGEGELCIKGPQIMKGYWKNSEATKLTIRDGWLHTGDIAKIDEDKNTYIVDRLKELIKVKGLQVAPAELEDLLRRHSAVSDVAVIGIPNERSGEVPKAFVVPAKNQNITDKDLMQFVEEKVASYKRLAEVEFVDIIPKSPSGKILRRLLR